MNTYSFFSFLDKDIVRYESENLDYDTIEVIPDMSYSVREILENFTRGNDMSFLERHDSYSITDIEDDTFDNVSDLTDIERIAHNSNNIANDIINEINSKRSDANNNENNINLQDKDNSNNSSENNINGE